MTSKKDLISIRVTHLEKLRIKQLAEDSHMTMTDYVRDTLLAQDVEQPSNDRYTPNTKESAALLAQLDVKDKELTEKNKQIDSLHKLLDQQQQLTLSSTQLTTDLKKQLETEQHSKTNKWYQFWRD